MVSCYNQIKFEMKEKLNPEKSLCLRENKMKKVVKEEKEIKEIKEKDWVIVDWFDY